MKSLKAALIGLCGVATGLWLSTFYSYDHFTYSDNSLIRSLYVWAQKDYNPHPTKVENCNKDISAIRDKVEEALSSKMFDKIDVDSKEIKVGDAFYVKKGEWVDIMNMDDVTNLEAFKYVPCGMGRIKKAHVTHHLKCDHGSLDSCVMSSDGFIEVLGFTKDGLALVEYNPLGGHTRQASCPPGIQYFASGAKLKGLEKVPFL